MHLQEITADRLTILQKCNTDWIVLFLQDDDLGEKAFSHLQDIVIQQDVLYPHLIAAVIELTPELIAQYQIVKVPQFQLYRKGIRVAQLIGKESLSVKIIHETFGS